jgi:hypothetical protein
VELGELEDQKAWVVVHLQDQIQTLEVLEVVEQVEKQQVELEQLEQPQVEQVQEVEPRVEPQVEDRKAWLVLNLDQIQTWDREKSQRL